jgi:1-phosphofructokinase family hexose kinase
MILTVTLNPLLERRLTFETVNPGFPNRDSSEELKPGGKGINVSSQLNCLGTENLAFTFLGGTNGKLLKQVLVSSGISFTYVQTRSETRYAVIVIDKKRSMATTFFSPDSVITSEECEEFKIKLEKMIRNCEIVIFSGSSPSGAADSIFPFGIETANKNDKISICDTYGAHLKDCIEKAPTIIHNNAAEVESSLGISLREEKNKTEFLDYLYSRGVKQSYITDGENPAYASNFDYHYKVESPEIKSIDATGSGDSFVAGIAYAWKNNLSFNEAVTLAASLGAANAATFEVSRVTMKEIEALKDMTRILPVGKKLKTGDAVQD